MFYLVDERILQPATNTYSFFYLFVILRDHSCFTHPTSQHPTKFTIKMLVLVYRMIRTFAENCQCNCYVEPSALRVYHRYSRHALV